MPLQIPLSTERNPNMPTLLRPPFEGTHLFVFTGPNRRILAFHLEDFRKVIRKEVRVVSNKDILKHLLDTRRIHPPFVLLCPEQVPYVLRVLKTTLKTVRIKARPHQHTPIPDRLHLREGIHLLHVIDGQLLKKDLKAQGIQRPTLAHAFRELRKRGTIKHHAQIVTDRRLQHTLDFLKNPRQAKHP